MNLPGAAGSTSRSSIIQASGGNDRPILQESYKYVLDEKGVRDFLAHNGELKLSVMHTKLDRETQSSEHHEMGNLSVPIDRSKLLHNQVLVPNQSLELAASDPDVQHLSLEKLTVQPTSINAVLSIQHGWKLDFPTKDETAPYLRDDKGNVYRYDPSGSVLMLPDGKVQLPFRSSVFFDESVDNLYLHIGEVTVYEKQPSGYFALSLGDSFPKTVKLKHKKMTIESAEFRNGYLCLKITKPRTDPQTLRGVMFTSPEYVNKDYPVKLK